MHLEKRQHERREYRVRFRCYMEGGTRYPALSLDLGKGGAFLTSRELPVPGSLIVVEAVDAARRPLPVLLVGRVVRTELGDRVGVGVQWVKAVIRRDPARLAQFLTHFFGLEDLQPPEIPEP
ncbi:MAG: PilZ domain-containing protein, partial [Deltaproteobacteria bacterium]|nr:PilZ domain-containing protein [Deltaproteobacteria bacterium]